MNGNSTRGRDNTGGYWNAEEASSNPRRAKLARLSRTPSMGVRDQIRLADSVSSVRMLLDKIASFKKAHPSTVRKCERAAEKRIKELSHE